GTEDVGGEAYRSWTDAERERARRRLAHALQQLVKEAYATGNRAAALGWAERWAELLPYDEEAYRLLIEALCLSGQGTAAAVRYTEYTTRLRRDLAVEPSAAFTQLAHRIDRHGRVPAGAVAGPGSAALFTPDMVGRDAQRSELLAAWQSVVRGGAAVVLVEGAEGMGKTLFCDEFVRSLEDQPGPVLLLNARAREEVPQVERAAACELLDGLVRAPGLSGVPDRALSEVAVLLPAIRSRWPQLPSPAGDERALHHAVQQVFAVVAQEQPIVAILDDFACADDASRRLVLTLARHPPPGLLLVLTVRTDGGDDAAATHAELRHLPGVRRLRLAPLGVKDVESLVASMLELPAGERERLAGYLWTETGGNPLFASEVVSAMVDEGHLTADARGIWRATAALGSTPLPLPSSVREAIGRRLERVGNAARQVIVAAATLDEPIDPARLRAATDLSPEQLQAALDELIARR
ncbi:MAG: AAA family ATPase, partial [Longimicrobiales bacterium]